MRAFICVCAHMEAVMRDEHMCPCGGTWDHESVAFELHVRCPCAAERNAQGWAV